MLKHTVTLADTLAWVIAAAVWGVVIGVSVTSAPPPVAPTVEADPMPTGDAGPLHVTLVDDSGSQSGQAALAVNPDGDYGIMRVDHRGYVYAVCVPKEPQ